MALKLHQVARQLKLEVELVQEMCRLRGTSPETLLGASASALRKTMRKLAYPEAARGRVEMEARRRRDDRGRIEPGALARAIGQARDMRLNANQSPRHVAGVPSHGHVHPLDLVGAGPAAAQSLAGAQWQWLGPGNIGGRTRAIVIHPSQPDRMLAASAGGGVWFTANGGARWDPIDDFMANLAVSCLAIDPTQPDIVYAGTGEGFGNADALRGGGLFRIVGGNSWQAIPGTQGFAAVNRLAVSADGQVVLAATPAGLMRSADPARATWTAVLPGSLADVKCHPTDPRLAVAGAVDGGCWFSQDGGASWSPSTHAGAWGGRVELAYARAKPSVVYASVDSDAGGELWRSTNGGKSFTRRPAKGSDGKPAPFLGGQGWYGNVVWAGDPTNANLVLIGGVNLWRSTDGGGKLREISTWWDSRSVHADHHAIVAHPGYDGKKNFTLFLGNDGGIYKVADQRQLGSESKPPYIKGYQELNNNYGVTQFYGGAVHAGSGRVVAGAQDNGSLALQPGADSEHWNSWAGGDGGYCAAHPGNDQVFYGEYVHLNIYRNADGAHTDNPDSYISGQFWNVNQWSWKPAPFQIPDARTETALFIAPFVLDPANPQRLLGGGLSLWQTLDADTPSTPTQGPSWKAIKPAVGSPISAIAIAPGHPEVVWVGHDDGRVFVSTNATAATPTWAACSGSAPKLKAQRQCARLLPGAQGPKVAYALFGGYVADNLWRTDDGGASWTPLGRKLPAAPANTLAQHPNKPQLLYIGTEVGLFSSEDGGLTWAPTNQGPANVAVSELFWAGTTLYAATHGRGMYRIDLSHA